MVLENLELKMKSPESIEKHSEPRVVRKHPILNSALPHRSVYRASILPESSKFADQYDSKRDQQDPADAGCADLLHRDAQQSEVIYYKRNYHLPGDDQAER